MSVNDPDYVEQGDEGQDVYDQLVDRDPLRLRDRCREAERKLASHDEGLDRWCNYQDRLVEVLDRLGLRQRVLAELENDGWKNTPTCQHKALLVEVAQCGFEDIDERLWYVEVQVDKALWAKLQPFRSGA